MRYKITLNYSGAEFCGWQIQPHDPSVQQALEEALSKLLGEKKSTTGAGRTDTGVNAIGYTAHFDHPEELDCDQLRYKLNAILPKSVAVLSVTQAGPDFHARFDASRREYTYFLHTSKDPFADSYSYLCPFHLDFDAMNEAAEALVGRHDFSCFEKVGADNRTSICTVEEAFWQRYTPSRFSVMPCGPATGEYWYFRISADRFLRNMVRAVVGTLLEVGRGKRTIDSFASLVLPAEDRAPKVSRRSMAGESVPGNALFLSKVEY